MRFEKQADSYLDTRTSLEWSLENYGPMTWNEAAAKNFGDGWRLPTIHELFSLVDITRYNPATELLDITPSDYWSSSTSAYYPDCAWSVYFSDGYVGCDHKTEHGYVRCVRGDKA